MVEIHNDWDFIRGELDKAPLRELLYRKILPNISYQPKKEDIFKVFEMPISKIKVVVLGLDPYAKPDTATGYAFAVKSGTSITPSLSVISTEIQSSQVLIDDCYYSLDWRTLKHWRKQGVFLLNTALTVETGRSGSHLEYWRPFTETVIKHLSLVHPCIWLLWGKKAQEFIGCIANPFIVKGYTDKTIKDIPVIDGNYVLVGSHPAAESYGTGKFIGNRHFVYTNLILTKNKKIAIKW